MEEVSLGHSGTKVDNREMEKRGGLNHDGGSPAGELEGRK